ncbi:ABC transporter ATP-binding protein [Alkalinema pantanalense CENA528]|uniref:ABC transporter ATP-binding protein n=1 Tax=Alkalinema pantanalense TaxID=1620705 RepID=UPI003D6DF9AD
MARSRLQQLGTYLQPHWKQAAGGIFALFLVNALSIYIPLQIRDGIRELRITFQFDRVLFYAAIVFVLASVMWVIRMVSRMLLFGVGRQVEFDLKQRIFNHLLRMEPSYFSTNTIGDLINRATSDVDNIRRLLGFAILSLANTIFAYGMTLPAMLQINVKLSLLALMIYPVMLVVVNLFSNKLRNQQIAVQERLSDLSELIQEDMSGISLIKIYAQEANERQAFEDLNDRLFGANLKLAKTRTTLFPILSGLAYGSSLILLWFGGPAIQRGELNIEDLIALFIFVEKLAFPTALMGFTITAYQRGEVSIDRIEAILSVEPKVQDAADTIPIAPEQIRGHLQARNLSYQYATAEGEAVSALKQIHFEILPGETVAIVGAIGSGKSTLANAIPRLLDIAPGQLFLDGIDITKMRLQDLRGAISYVPQDSFLFSTSIRNNIAYGLPTATDLEIEQAAKEAQIHPEILNFPQHYDTLVGERGITLSGGQRQRTALARALLVDSPILILDDALSSVDNQTATKILNNLSEGTRRKTVIFISHQLSAAAMADRIFVMDQGKTQQMGNHETLLATPGLYQTLWNQQQLVAVVEA